MTRQLSFCVEKFDAEKRSFSVSIADLLFCFCKCFSANGRICEFFNIMTRVFASCVLFAFRVAVFCRKLSSVFAEALLHACGSLDTLLLRVATSR
jgi:hypothetical protein